MLARALVPAAELTPSALQALEQHAWPGNVAELRGALLYAVALAGDATIDVGHLPLVLRHVPPVDVLIQLPEDGLNMEAVEISLLRQALERAQGNKTRAAELLGLTRHTLLYRLEKYGLDT